jgi:hypothetical protein
MSFFPDYTKITTVTSAQIRALHTAPVLLAPGSPGCIVDIKSVLVEYNAGSQGFTVGATDVLALITGNSIPNVFVIYAGGLFLVSGTLDGTDSGGMLGFPWWGTTNPLSSVIGQGIYLYQFDSNLGVSGGANWTGGNGSINVKVQYSYIVA